MEYINEDTLRYSSPASTFEDQFNSQLWQNYERLGNFILMSLLSFEVAIFFSISVTNFRKTSPEIYARYRILLFSQRFYFGGEWSLCETIVEGKINRAKGQ